MRLDCTIEDLDVSNKQILFALEHIGANSTFELTLERPELIDILNQYSIDKLDMDLKQEGATFTFSSSSDIKMNVSDIDSEYTIDFIINELKKHFGNSVIRNKFDPNDMDTVELKTSVIMRKIFKLADIEKEQYTKTYFIYYDNLKDFQDSWVEEYMKKEKKNEKNSKS